MSYVQQGRPERLIDENGKRINGRGLFELRPIKMKVGVLENADGSAYIEWGRNKIIVAVYGPKEIHPRHLALPTSARLRCRYNMAAFSTPERKKPGPDRRSIELSKVIREALKPALFLEKYPKTVIDVFIEILQSEGGTRVASITAASLALADSGIPMRDLVTACAVGKVDGKIVLDLDAVEDMYGEADLPVAIMPRKKEVTLLQMDGRMTTEEFNFALEKAMEACEEIYRIQREALLEKYKAGW